MVIELYETAKRMAEGNAEVSDDDIEVLRQWDALVGDGASKVMRKTICDEKLRYLELQTYEASVRDAEMVVADVVGVVDSDQLNVSVGWQVGLMGGAMIHLKLKNDASPIKLVLRRLAQAGYRRSSEPKDYPEIGRRTYTTCHPDRGTIRLLCFFLVGEKAEGASCRFVQTGTEERPIYELRCNEDEDNAI